MKLLIAGCGYVGSALAKLALAEGHAVIGLTRSAESAETLGIELGPMFQPLVADLTDDDSVRGLPDADAVVQCAAAGRGGGAAAYRQVYVDGIARLIARFRGRPLLFTSSSSVYAQIDGSEVTEQSPAEPDRETGKMLREAENRALSAGGAVVRLAGLYGPRRSVLLRQFLAGEAQIDIRTEPPATPDGRWINQIHRDDAASALWHAIQGVSSTAGYAGEIFNAADSTPMTQRQLYTELARRLARPLPPEGPPALDRKRGWTHKRVSAAKLRGSGWGPAFPSWFDALDRHGLELAAPAR